MFDIIKKVTVLLMISLCCCVAFAQKVKKETGVYTYVLPKNETEEQGKFIALERAREDAINKAFGQIISRENITRTDVHNGEATTDFSSLGQSLTKGEWVETIGEPEFVVNYDQTLGSLVITCTVRGRVRELMSAKAEFEWKVLKNVPESKFESYDFKDADQLYLSFQTPKDGYVAIYLIDAENKANCLLPYASDPDGQEPVVHGQEYVFFTPQNNVVDDFIVDTSSMDNEIKLYCNDNTEINRIRVIFSPNPFTKPVDQLDRATGIRSLSLEKFEKWLGESQRKDSQMTVDTRNVTVSK